MSTRSDYLAAIVSCMESITTDNGFDTDVKKVLRGIRSREDFSGQLPGIAIWNERAPREESSFSESVRFLAVHIWGFIEVDAVGNDYSALDALIADVEKALMTEKYNANWARTAIGDLMIYEGGADDSFGEFDMVLQYAYEYEYTNP